MFNHEIADRICERLAEGESLRSICRDDGMPARSEVFKRLAADKAFADQYARAREFGIEAMADDLSEISDDGRNDWMERHGERDPGWVVNGENVQRSKLRVDTRKWMLSKLAPKKYGDKLALEHSGSVGLSERIKRAEQRTGKKP